MLKIRENRQGLLRFLLCKRALFTKKPARLLLSNKP